MATHTGLIMTSGFSNELKAMGQLETALEGLQEEERVRVLQWANSRYGFVAPLKAKTSPAAPTKDAVDDGEEKSTYEDLATFYDAAGPTADADKALVGAYWFQIHEGAPDVEAQNINTSLKHLGHGIGNITRALENLKAMKPALIVQTRKDGTSKQARKKFKVTSEGKKAVERMIKAKAGAAA